MTNQHPITPPPYLTQKWLLEAHHKEAPPGTCPDTRILIARAAQWGADQQLAEDAKWLDHNALNEPHLRITPVGELLKKAMRPKSKPPSLKEQALADLSEIGSHYICPGAAKLIDTIRRALEALPE